MPWCRWTRPWCAVFRFWNLPTRRNSPTAASTAAARWQKWTKNKLPPSRSQQQQQQQPTNQQQHAMMQTSNTKAAFVLGDPSKGSHAAESKEEMMARAVRMKRKTKSCDAWGNFIHLYVLSRCVYNQVQKEEKCEVSDIWRNKVSIPSWRKKLVWDEKILCSTELVGFKVPNLIYSKWEISFDSWPKLRTDCDQI